MLSPKEQNIKYHRGRMRGTKTRGNEIVLVAMVYRP
jgi:hypothetical protein